MKNLIEFTFLLSVIGYVYVMVLTRDGMILSWWYDFVVHHIKKDWILKPLLLCEYCVCGQLAFWFYPIYFFSTYNIFIHITYVSLTVFWVLIYNKWLKLSD